MSDQDSEPRNSTREEKSPAPPRAEESKTAPAPSRPRLVVVYASLLGLGLLFFANAWERDFWSADELRVAAIVAEAEASGDWLTPRIGGEPELGRPPLVFWLPELLAFVSSGDARWTYRLPVAFFALVSLALTCWLGGVLFSRRIGFAAMLIQAATFCFFTHSTWLGGDLVFATFCQLGVAGLVLATRAKDEHALWWALLGWGGLAGAALSKSFLLGPVLVLGSLFLFLFFQGGVAAVLRGWFRMRVLPGLVLFAALVLPWYSVMYYREGADVLFASLLQHLGMIADPIREVRPAYFHVARGLVDFLPWTLFVPLGLYHAKDRMKRSGEGLCLFAILFPVILLSLVPAKEPGDLLAVCPYVSLLIAASLLETGERFSLWEGYLRTGSLWLTRILLVLPLAVIGALAVMLGVDLAFGESWLTLVLTYLLEPFGVLPAGGEPRLWVAFREPASFAVPLGILVAAAVVAFVYSFMLRRRMEARAHGRVVIELPVVALCLFVAGGFFYRDANSLASSRGFVEKVNTQVGDAPLTLYGARPAAFYYYLSRPPEYVESLKPASGDETPVDRLREKAQQAERVYIVAPKRAYDLLRRDYPSLTAMLKEVDRGYMGWSREMVLLSNKP